MRVLAIDPGNTDSAFCLVGSDTLRPLTFAKLPNAEVLAIVRSLPTAIVDADVVVIERVASYGMAVGREVFETCEWIGRFTEAAVSNGIRVEYIYRKDEKLHICMDSRAKDANIRRALIDRFAEHDLKNGRGTKSKPDFFYGFAADIWSSYAVAITFIETRCEDGQQRD